MLRLDMREFEQAATRMGAALDQVPFALSRALNDAVRATDTRLATETWPTHVTARNKSFLKASLEPRYSTKRDLSVELFDRLGHVNLSRLETGGTKRPVKAARVAIPTARVARGGGGAVRRNQKPAALKRKVVKGGLIFQAEGRGKNSKLRLMYKLQPGAQIKPTVPFHQDFARFMREEARRTFAERMRQAMATRR